jgi:hypothetical protein
MADELLKFAVRTGDSQIRLSSNNVLTAGPIDSQTFLAYVE